MLVEQRDATVEPSRCNGLKAKRTGNGSSVLQCVLVPGESIINPHPVPAGHCFLAVEGPGPPDVRVVWLTTWRRTKIPLNDFFFDPPLPCISRPLFCSFCVKSLRTLFPFCWDHLLRKSFRQKRTKYGQRLHDTFLRRYVCEMVPFVISCFRVLLAG